MRFLEEEELGEALPNKLVQRKGKNRRIGRGPPAKRVTKTSKEERAMASLKKACLLPWFGWGQ